MPADQAFTGFGDDIVVIVATALLVSAAVARSGITERLMAPLAPHLSTVGRQVVVLVGVVTMLSAFVKNVGALAILMPIVFQQARRAGTPAVGLLMPLAFGSLLGGLMTLIGTSPNVIVSRMRAELLGQPFTMFDFMPVGAGIAAGRRRPSSPSATGCCRAAARAAASPRRRSASRTTPPRRRCPRTRPWRQDRSRPRGPGRRRGHGHHDHPRAFSPLRAVGALDALSRTTCCILQGEQAALERVVARAKLKLATKEVAAAAVAGSEVGVVEAVIGADSPLVGRTAAELALRARYQVNVVAVSRSGARLTQRLRAMRFRAGDVIVLQGDLDALPDTLAELRLPAAGRARRVARHRAQRLAAGRRPGGGDGCWSSLQLVPVSVGFFGAAVVLLLLRVLTLREA